MPAPYRIELASSVVPRIHHLSYGDGRRLVARLAEVADSAAHLPPPSHPAWRNWRGLGEGCFSILVALWRCSYVLDRRRRRVIVLALRRMGERAPGFLHSSDPVGPPRPDVWMN